MFILNITKFHTYFDTYFLLLYNLILIIPCLESLQLFACQCWPIGQSWWVLYNQFNFYWFWGNIYFWSVHFFLCFSLVAINWQISYDSCICRRFLWNHTRFISANLAWFHYPSSRLENHMQFADWFTIWIVHLPGGTETDLITASDPTVQAVLAAIASFISKWMDDLRFYVLFNSISVISGRWEVDNERQCAMEPCLRLRRFRLEQGSNSRPLDQ